MAQTKILGYEFSDTGVIALVAGLIVIIFLIFHEINTLPSVVVDTANNAIKDTIQPFIGPIESSAAAVGGVVDNPMGGSGKFNCCDTIAKSWNWINGKGYGCTSGQVPC